MAYENINIGFPNFCIGPQSGTFCTIDTSDLKTYMRIVNATGSTVMSLTLSSNILTENTRIDYVGPSNLSSMPNGAAFFTFESISNTTCLIKRWEANIEHMELSLKEQVVKHTSGDIFINPIDFAVEQHSTTISQPNEKYNYIYVDDATYITKGTVVYVGPSSDASNLYAFERVIVSNVATDIHGNRLDISSDLKNEYAIGDNVNFYSNIYVISSEGFGGDTSVGSVIKIDAYNWSIKEIDNKHVYKNITMCKWCKQFNSISGLIGANLLFIEPYNSYNNYRSMFMNNIDPDEYTAFDIYDITFDNYTIYKLQKKVSLRSAEGQRTSYQWLKYNFQQDTIANYSNILLITSTNSTAIGYSKEIIITGYLRDQYFTGLRDVQVIFTKSGDSTAVFQPADGRVVTDINGKFTMKYISGSTYNGVTVITATAQNGSVFTGSITVSNKTSVTSMVNITNQNVRSYSLNNPTTDYYGRQTDPIYKVYVPGEVNKTLPKISINSKTFFTNPGGDWGSAAAYPGVTWLSTSDVEKWLPMLYLGDNIQVDSPRGGEGYGFEIKPESDIGTIAQRDTFVSYNGVKSALDFLSYVNKPDIGEPTFTSIKHYNIESSCAFSQLKMSGHNFIMDGAFYDSLITYVKLNQFVFVEEAIPAFWSSKNAIDSYIWLRLRPFAFSINPQRTSMYIREVNGDFDSGYINVTNYLSIGIFNAGSNVNGIEVYYEPWIPYMYNSRVFVTVETYDIAATPNRVMIEYWFDIIPDYEAPYLSDRRPDMEDNDVSVYTPIEFDIHDDGAGVDISSMELYINSRTVDNSLVSVTKINDKHYSVIYTPESPLYYNKEYKILVKIADKAVNVNRSSFSYRFYTEDSPDTIIIDKKPSLCDYSANRFSDVSMVLLPGGEKINIKSLKLQVSNRDVSPFVLPVFYRIE